MKNIILCDPITYFASYKIFTPIFVHIKQELLITGIYARAKTRAYFNRLEA